MLGSGGEVADFSGDRDCDRAGPDARTRPRSPSASSGQALTSFGMTLVEETLRTRECVVRIPCEASGDDEMQGVLRLRHALRCADRVSPLRMTGSVFGLEAGRMARQVLLAAKAPSPSSAGGSWADGRACQVRPSSVRRSSNFSLPDSSGM